VVHMYWGVGTKVSIKEIDKCKRDSHPITLHLSTASTKACSILLMHSKFASLGKENELENRIAEVE